MAEFSNVQDAYENLRQHELQTNSRYASSKVTKDFGKIGLETAKKVFWEDPSEVLHGRINFSGTPFVILGRKIFDCQFGKNRKEKRKLQKDLERRDEDHRYTKGKKFLMQDSKKIGCPARCVFREICRFPTFTIDKDTPKSQRRKIAEELLSKIRSGENVVSERVVIAHLASIEDHTCHTLGEITPEPIDPRLAQKIAEMCQSGVSNLDAMRTLLNSYVKDICRPLPHPSNKRFYPSDKCISNHMYRAKSGGKKEDQQAVVDLISEWQKKPGDFIYYRLKSSETLPNNDNKSVEAADAKKKHYMPWMKRHIMFTKQRGLPHSQGFGEALFSPQAICMIKVNLRKRFQKLKDSSSIYSVHYVIPSVANEDLKSFFEEETGQSENYIYKVMVKEAMITIMQEAIGDEYENVDVELRKTEGKTTNKSNSLLLNYIMNDREKYIQLHKRN